MFRYLSHQLWASTLDEEVFEYYYTNARYFPDRRHSQRKKMRCLFRLLCLRGDVLMVDLMEFRGPCKCTNVFEPMPRPVRASDMPTLNDRSTRSKNIVHCDSGRNYTLPGVTNLLLLLPVIEKMVLQYIVSNNV